MTTISISQLKTNPAAAIEASIDYPLAVLSRSKIKAYLVGKDLFEKIYQFLEDWEDTRAVKSIKKSDWGKGKTLDKVAKELDIEI